jgi:hypothetical protein
MQVIRNIIKVFKTTLKGKKVRRFEDNCPPHQASKEKEKGEGERKPIQRSGGASQTKAEQRLNDDIDGTSEVNRRGKKETDRSYKYGRRNKN